MIELPAFKRLPRGGPALESSAPASDQGRRAADETRRLWARATWFGIATYFAWSPITVVNRLLPAGSATRGLVLTVIPLIGIASLRRVSSSRRLIQADVLAVLLGLLVVWEAISVEVNAGMSSLAHVVPGVAILFLALGARRVERGMSLADIRFALTGMLPPLSLILVIGWIAQYARLIPLAAANASTIRLSIDGYRLQGLNNQPNNLGFLAALVTLIAFAAQPGAMAWFTRVVGAVTLVATDSRTSFIALGIGLLVLWVFGPGRNGSSRVVAVVGLAATGIGAWGLINVQRQGNTDVLSGRDVIWHDLIPFLHHVPLFGYGPNLFPQLVPLVFGPYAVPGQLLDPQNQWLNDALEFGFVGAALLTLCVLSMPFHSSRTYRWALVFPLLAMVIVEGFSEVPLALFSSIDGAFPLFLLVMLAPRPAAAPRLLKFPPVLRRPFRHQPQS